MRIRIIASFLFFSYSVYAQVADLEVTTDLSLYQEVESFKPYDFTVTITNHGPDPIGSGDPLDFIRFFELSKQQLNEDQQLDFRIYIHPGVDPYCIPNLRIESSPDSNVQDYIYELYLPGLQPGETVVCGGLQFVVFYKQGFRSFSWHTEPGLTNSDPSPANNSVSFSIGVPPRLIPSLNVFGVVLMSFLFFALVLRNRNLFQQ